MKTLVFGLVLGALAVVAGCKGQPTEHPDETKKPEPAPVVLPHQQDGGKRALAVYDELQKKIDAGSDTKTDRRWAYDRILTWDDKTAAYAFARAALAGRRAQSQGLSARHYVAEAEKYALESIERDPNFRDGAARRLLGSLYVLAPPRMVDHGDSEKGLEMLEEDVAAYPDRPESHLRLAEAYIALGDIEPGLPHLCDALASADALGGEDRRLLDKLIIEVGGAEVLGCEPAATPPADASG